MNIADWSDEALAEIRGSDREEELARYVVRLRALLHSAETTPLAEWATQLAAAKENAAGLAALLKEAEAERDALAGQVSALMAAIAGHSQSTHECQTCGRSDPRADDDVCLVVTDVTAAAEAHDAAVRRAALAEAITIVELQPYAPDTAVGRRQQWVKEQIISKLQAVARGAK